MYHKRFHYSLFGMSWSPANAALALLLTLILLFFLLLFMTLTAQPAQGQSRVPPTAVQAARMPKFAPHPTHPVQLAPAQSGWRIRTEQARASYKNPNPPELDIADGRCRIPTYTTMARSTAPRMRGR